MASKRKRAPGAGRPAKIQGFKVLTIRLAETSLAELRLHAALRGVSLSDLGREVLVSWCEEQDDHRRLRRLAGRKE